MRNLRNRRITATPIEHSIGTTPQVASEWSRLKAATADLRAAPRFAPPVEGPHAKGFARPPGLGQSPVSRMLQARTLAPAQARAAIEIARIWEQVTRGLTAKVMQFDRKPRGAPTLDWPAVVADAYVRRYVPWRDDGVGKSLVAEGVSIADLVISFAADGHSLETIAARYRVGVKRARGWVLKGLTAYCQIAGWSVAYGEKSGHGGLMGDNLAAPGGGIKHDNKAA